MSRAGLEEFFLDSLQQRPQAEWDALVLKLARAIHPVDREATRSWFAFWPLKLDDLLEREDREGTVRDYRLTGRFQLTEVLDESVGFLYGAHYWVSVKQAIVRHVESFRGHSAPNLELSIRESASRVALTEQVPDSVTLGITAVGFLALRHVGLERIRKARQQPATATLPQVSPDKLVAARSRRRGDGLLDFLRSADRRYRVTFRESKPRDQFIAICGQDLSMASASDTRDHRSRDPRCLEGPIPFECRSGSCGTCWVGVVGGRENLDPQSPYELKRLRFFGYVDSDSPSERHPPLRLACQAKCRGNVTVVVPPWNGMLKGRS